MHTLLLIEDDPSIQEIIKNYFSKRQFTVNICEDSYSALKILKTNSVDIIFLDVMLPKDDGFSICRKIRKLYSVPIIFLTARVSEKDKLTGYGEGADDYVTERIDGSNVSCKYRLDHHVTCAGPVREASCPYIISGNPRRSRKNICARS